MLASRLEVVTAALSALLTKAHSLVLPFIRVRYQERLPQPNQVLLLLRPWIGQQDTYVHTRKLRRIFFVFLLNQVHLSQKQQVIIL